MTPATQAPRSSRLERELLALSSQTEWQKARSEWVLTQVWQEPSGTCLCGHYPITDHCLVHNQVTGARAVLGNCCVNRILGLDYSDVFKAVARLRKNQEGSVPTSLLVSANEFGWLNEWELSFSWDTRQKRKLSEKQRECRRRINSKLLRQFSRGGSNG